MRVFNRGYYHVYSRGADKRALFLDECDYNRFIFLLYTANTTGAIHLSDLANKNSDKIFSLSRDTPLVRIGAYCLMPNHIHILVREFRENGLSLFMKKLLTAYSMYFNKKYSRTGVLFEGRFKAEHVGEDRYLKYLFSYIHLNPVKLIEPLWRETGLKSIPGALYFLESYKYSSYDDYSNRARLQSSILDRSVFPDYFRGDRLSFLEFIAEWLEFGKDGP